MQGLIIPAVVAVVVVIVPLKLGLGFDDSERMVLERETGRERG